MTQATEAPSLPAASNHVQRLWATNVALTQVADSQIPDVPEDLLASSEQAQHHRIDVLGEHAATIRQLFTNAVTDLADIDRSLGVVVPAVERVNLELQVWNPGFEIPVWVDSGPYLGWLFLSATPAQHSDSGSIAVLDPRAGSGMSAIPGLPWGTSLVIRPQRGGFAVVPGWLTSSVLPLEQHQTCVVVVATTGSGDAG
ncbi:hypothetical protein ACFTS5_10935 [Nocardia sp. NPDC056952]|uniref:hypothetical protein n=1 Tax=Nocardia sp. NPDC056952 TaxID=3345979 RepID=UPI00362FB284